MTAARSPSPSVRPSSARARARRAVPALGLLAAAALLSACAAGADTVASPPGTEVAGFWLGLWHGIILVVAFVVSLFNDHVGIYEVHNNGGWYNFGFVLGVLLISGGGGGAGARSARKR